jgi:hypothetical protein
MGLGMPTSQPSWSHRARPLPARAVGAALVTGLTLGVRHALQPQRDEPAIVVEDPGEPPPEGSVTLYFHPEVPEATLVLVRP